VSRHQIAGGLLGLSVRPITSRLGSRFGRFEIRPSRTVEISPACRRYRPAAIALQDELERVTHFHEWTPTRDIIRQQALDHLSEGEEVHPATTALRIDDVLIADGCVHRPASLSVITKEKRRAILSGPVEEVGEAQLTTTHCGSIYFGDWLMVDIPIELLAQQRGIPPLSLTHQTFGHEPDYRKAFQLTRPPRPQSIVRARSLWMMKDNDRGMTADRVARYQLLRGRIRNPRAKSPRRVFVDRGQWGNQRGLRNRDQVLAALEGRGFEAIYPENMTVEELSSALSSAEICVGIEGSAMCHAAMLLPPGAAMLAIVPEDRFLTYLKWFTDAFDMRYGYVIGQRPERGAPDVIVDINRLLATLDLVERAV
jgi:hypothetical protein